MENNILLILRIFGVVTIVCLAFIQCRNNVLKSEDFARLKIWNVLVGHAHPADAIASEGLATFDCSVEPVNDFPDLSRTVLEYVFEPNFIFCRHFIMQKIGKLVRLLRISQHMAYI